MAGCRRAVWRSWPQALAVQVIDPEVHKLVEEGPGRRRRFLDWGVFHVEHGFLEGWRRYRRALKQRNAALKQGQRGTALAGWEAQMVEAGTEIGHQRQRYLDRLNAQLGEVGKRLVEAELNGALSPGMVRRSLIRRCAVPGETAGRGVPGHPCRSSSSGRDHRNGSAPGAGSGVPWAAEATRLRADSCPNGGPSPSGFRPRCDAAGRPGRRAGRSSASDASWG